MLSRDLEVRALRIESMRLVAQAENVLKDLRAHQGNLEQFLLQFRETQVIHQDVPGKDQQ